MSRTKHIDDISTPTRAPVPARIAIAATAAMGKTAVPSLAALMFAPDGRLGQYELIRELGRGGMGTVYLARDMRLGRRVAIKLLDLRGDHANARFLAESRLTARCNHENIVTIYDIGEHDHHPYMVLEYVDGRTLSAWLEERSGGSGNLAPLEPSLAVALMIPVVRALAYAHDLGIVHRDLKPANIMITDVGTIKVLDFGIATLLAGTELSSDYAHIPSLLDASAIVGTLAYMAPEQLEGENVDHRADLWAVGIMLYQMVTGVHPVLHNGVDLKRALLDIASLDLPMPRVGDRRIDLAPLDGAIDRCLIKHKAHRTRDAHVLLKELAAVSTREASGPGRIVVPAPRVEPEPPLATERTVSRVTASTLSEAAMACVAPPRGRRRWPLAATTAGLIGIVIVAVAASHVGGGSPVTPAMSTPQPPSPIVPAQPSFASTPQAAPTPPPVHGAESVVTVPAVSPAPSAASPPRRAKPSRPTAKPRVTPEPPTEPPANPPPPANDDPLGTRN